MPEQINFEHILTHRELEICALIAKGHPSGQIADRIHISLGTAKNHITAIFDKTGIKNRTELTTKYNEYIWNKTVLDDSPQEPFCPEPQEHAVAILRLINGNNLPSIINLPVIINLIFKNRSFTIGRYSGIKQWDFEFESATKGVSRLHAEIFQVASGYAIKDLKSRFGTFINGRQLAPGRYCPILHGDRVSFGGAGADYTFEELSE
jgi:DNA-binding CsgD family transcriptional regulator